MKGVFKCVRFLISQSGRKYASNYKYASRNANICYVFLNFNNSFFIKLKKQFFVFLIYSILCTL